MHPFSESARSVALEAMVEARELLGHAIARAKAGRDVEELLDGVAASVQRAKDEGRKAKVVEQEVSR